jgi:hypothetical protein
LKEEAMTTGSQIGSVLAALVVGAGVGFLIGRSSGAPPQGATFTVVVGPTAAELSIPTVTLSARNGERVIWLAKDSARTLLIEFAEQPFNGMQRQPNLRYRVPCQAGRCDSGSINKSATYKDYKYWQTLVDATGTRDEVDGHIIIQN